MSQLITIGSQTNSNHHVPVGAQVNPKELNQLIEKVSAAISWDLLPSAEAVKLSEYPLCSFVDENGEDWEWDEPWDQTVVNVTRNGVDIIFVHEHSGHELFFSYALEEAETLPIPQKEIFVDTSGSSSNEIAKYDVKTMDDLVLYVEGYSLEECITSAEDFNNIDNDAFQAAKNAYFETKQALQSHLEDESNHNTPINSKRMAEHGWEGLNTVYCVNEMLECEGFEYGILHKSSFLSVDDATFHQLKNEFVQSHYALCEAIGLSDIVRTTAKPFIPM